MCAFSPAFAAVLTELRKQRQGLSAQLDQIDAAIAALTGLEGGSSALEAVTRPLSLKELSYAKAAEVVLQRANREPLTTKVLLARLAAGGKPVGGGDPYRILYRALMKNSRFRNVGGRWALADWYPEPVGPVDDGGGLFEA